ncbi:hypothetical protein Moror_8126 [Moniliophthora roreri MCA 2997]|uniref:glutathione transferase n=2 Tax=Moniliophthora roreri TaxID=221103 RepID=V2X5Q0_MONRO|nr:hypothetical protein Moror_8126 [Moniliophthora roreri MCA 2997]
MVLKLYGSRLATCSARVEVVLIEKQIPYEFIEVNLIPSVSEQKTEAHKKKQPFGKVPYIDDDGFILYESRAICRYLEAAYAGFGTRLAPPTSDVKATALFEQAISIEMTEYDPSATKAGHMLIEILAGIPFNQSSFEAAISELSSRLDGYETILGRQRYLAGNELTMADLFHLPYGAWLTQAGSDILTTKGPHVARWWNEISSLESWKNVQDMAPGLLKNLKP